MRSDAPQTRPSVTNPTATLPNLVQHAPTPAATTPPPHPDTTPITDPTPDVRRWIQVKDVYRIYYVELDAIDDPELRHQRLVELNVREQVYRLCSTSYVQRRWGNDMGAHVHGWAYDLRHGLLKDLEIDPADEPARRIYDLGNL